MKEFLPGQVLFNNTFFHNTTFDSSAFRKAFATPPVAGVSACLRGEKVRYDGGDKFQPLIEQYAAPQLTLQPVCPEFTGGLGVPRPAVQIVQTDNEYRALGVEEEDLDVTESILHATEQLLAQFAGAGLSGFILKSRSPSCGLGSTPLHNCERQSQHTGSGLFAHRLRHRYPHLPIVEETWLENREHCQWFVLACYLYRGAECGLLPAPGAITALGLPPVTSAAALLPSIAGLCSASSKQIRSGLAAMQTVTP